MFKKTAVAGLMALLMSFGVLNGSVSAAKDAGSYISVTMGKRMVASHNIQQAKDGAISDALGAAVQNAFSELLTTQAIASNIDFLYTEILSHPSDFITTYRSLSGIEHKGAFLVAVESRVNLEMLQKALTDAKILDVAKDKPVIMFFISEKTPSDDLPRHWWGKDSSTHKSLAEETISEKMVRNRFMLVGSGPQRPDPSFYNITFSSAEDVNAARALGKEMKANMIIFGNAVSSLATNRMGEEKTFDAEILLQAYDVNTGEKIISSKVQAVAKNDSDEEGYTQALVKAAGLSAEDLTEKINSYWNRNLRKEQIFDLKLSGDNFLPRFIALKQRFKDMPEMINSLQKEIGSNSALVQIQYKGNPSRFANAVMLKTFDSFGLEITEVTDTLVTIRFIEKQQTPSTEGLKSPAL
ncbi:MAG: hypothetical protein WC836_10490 [Desulfobacula sp.]|jgi:hypothetical protein